MSEYHGPPMPEDDSEEHGLTGDEMSEEEIFSAIRENLGEDKFGEEDVSPEAILEVWDFLKDLQVVGAEDVATAEIETLLNHLNKDPSLVKDFVYTVMDIKTGLNHSQYPIAISIYDLLGYAGSLDNAYSIRPHFIQMTSGHIKQLGLDRKEYVERAWGGPHISTKNSEAIRLLGFLVSMPFMSGLNSELDRHQRTNDVDTLTLMDLMYLCMVEVRNNLSSLKGQTSRYHDRYDLEVEAKVRHEEIITAMQGLHNICLKAFMDRNT